MIPVWLFLAVAFALIAALGAVCVQRDRARAKVGELQAELAGTRTWIAASSSPGTMTWGGSVSSVPPPQSWPVNG